MHHQNLKNRGPQTVLKVVFLTDLMFSASMTVTEKTIDALFAKSITPAKHVTSPGHMCEH